MLSADKYTFGACRSSSSESKRPSAGAASVLILKCFRTGLPIVFGWAVCCPQLVDGHLLVGGIHRHIVCVKDETTKCAYEHARSGQKSALPFSIRQSSSGGREVAWRET